MHKTFSQALIEHLENTGVRVTEIAAATGVHKDALYKLKYGKTRNMSVDDAIKVAAFFGETVEEFMGIGPGALRDTLMDQIAQLSESERQIFEASLKAVLAARDHGGEAQEPDRSAEEDQ